MKVTQSEMKKRWIRSWIFCVVVAGATYFLMDYFLEDKFHVKTDVHSFQSPHLPRGAAFYSGQSLMEELGFGLKPRLFPQSYHDDENIPVILSAADSQSFPDLQSFVRSLRVYFPEKRLVIYNLGMTVKEKKVVRFQTLFVVNHLDLIVNCYYRNRV